MLTKVLLPLRWERLPRPSRPADRESLAAPGFSRRQLEGARARGLREGLGSGEVRGASGGPRVGGGMEGPREGGPREGRGWEVDGGGGPREGWSPLKAGDDPDPAYFSWGSFAGPRKLRVCFFVPISLLTLFLLLCFPPPAALTALQFAWEGNRDFLFALSAGTSVLALRGLEDAALWGKPGWQEVAGLLEEVLGWLLWLLKKIPRTQPAPSPSFQGAPRGERDLCGVDKVTLNSFPPEKGESKLLPGHLSSCGVSPSDMRRCLSGAAWPGHSYYN
uniref:Uncharacterized protein n=1 Tax=Papio anubis TaxID=9555 RepID=A0A8I5NXV7_PAPAN